MSIFSSPEQLDKIQSLLSKYSASRCYEVHC